MAKRIADRVLETTTSTGTGSITLAGAVPGFQSCATAGCVDGDTIDLYIEAVDARGVPTGDWECGTYTYGTGGTLARTTVRSSSNGGAAVSFAAGTKRVGAGLLAFLVAQIGAAANMSIVEVAGPTVCVPETIYVVTSSSVVLDLPQYATGQRLGIVEVFDGGSYTINFNGTKVRGVDYGNSVSVPARRSSVLWKKYNSDRGFI